MAVEARSTRDTTTVDAKRLGQLENYDSNVARLNRLNEGDIIEATVHRYDPSVDVEPYYETYKVPYVKWMRVLDVLNYLAEELEIELAHRWYCGVKKCGTCAVRVNGREVLACWEAAEPVMVIEPLRHLPVVRDLIVDRQPYEKLVMRMAPWLERKEPYPGFPEYITDRQMRFASRGMDCISCMACYSACPVLDLGDETQFSGPAPLVQLAQTALDPRDGMDRGRIAMEEASVFSCVSCYRCEEVCPVEIPIVTGVIEPLKAKAYESMPRHTRHQRAFLDIIEARGRIDPSGLVIKTQRWNALKRISRIFRLLRTGKINPIKTLLGEKIPNWDQTKYIFRKLRGPK